MIIKAKYNIATNPGEYQSIYLETSADQVLFNDGENLQQKLDSGRLGMGHSISQDTDIENLTNGAILFNNNGKVGAKFLSAKDVNAIPNGIGQGDYLISTDGNISIQTNDNSESRSNITLKVGQNRLNISSTHIDIPSIIQTSDKRLKSNISQVDDETYFNLVKKININTYNFNGSERKSLGVIAQDLINVNGSNEIISYNKEQDLYGIDNYGLTSAIMSALKFEINKREKLEEEVEELKRILGIKKDTL